MKEPSPRPDQSLPLNFTMAIVLLPVFAAFVAITHSADRAAGLWSGDATLWELSVIYTFLFAIPLVALLLILWKGWGRLPLVLLVLSFMGFGLQRINYSPDRIRHIDLLFGGYGMTGLDVYCNGEHLGKTPLQISDEKFRRRCHGGPRRRVKIAWSRNRSPWCWAKFTWVPVDVLSKNDHWPPSTDGDFIGDDKKTLAND